MKTNQPQFKMRKPMALTLDIIDSQTPKGSHSKPQVICISPLDSRN